MTADRMKKEELPAMTDNEALDQIAATLGLWTTDPGNNPVTEVLTDIIANVQATGRKTNVPEGA